MVYAKPPFADPEAVLAYLSQYTHRVAKSNSRLLCFDEAGVTFRYKDYRQGGANRQQIMSLAADEFIRRFILYALPRVFHPILHYGLRASATRKDHLERARQLIDVPPHRQTMRPASQRSCRPALAATAPWSSSRYSNVAISPARRRFQRHHW